MERGPCALVSDRQAAAGVTASNNQPVSENDPCDGASASLVTNLTSATFLDFVTSNELSLISFIAPWCPHCHALYPTFEATADALQTYNWPLARINCDTDKELCREFKVPIYPTIRIFHGEEHSLYNGKRRVDAMVAVMKRHSQPIVTKLDTAPEAAEFSARDRVTIIGHFDDDDSLSNEAFKELAKTQRDDYLFGYTSDPAFGSAEKIEKPSIVIYKAFDEGRNVYQGPFDSDNITAFVTEVGVPRIKEIGKDLNGANSMARPLAIVFARGEEQREELQRNLWPVAETTKGEMRWIILDPETEPEYAPRVAVPGGEWPAFALEDKKNDFKYAYPKRGSMAELSQAAIRQVVDQFSKKQLTSSEDLPSELPSVDSGDESAKATDDPLAQDPLSELELLSGGAWKVSRDEL